ncbi:unnamed protein product [Cuscuta epithymum]|uniref:Helicase-like transcription factor CHR28 n=1 Tax=Cuscuta epithymum TaxID=186058 RepID=A0AAV0CRF2_9ASTE|nr:unnamed protein product [Cuscuta epithymum]
MMMTDNTSELRYPEELSAASGEACGKDSDDLSIDIDDLLSMLGEKDSDNFQSRSGDSSSNFMPHVHSSSKPPFSASTYGPETFNCLAGASRPGSYEVGSVVHSSVGSLPHWMLPGNGKLCSDADSPSKSDSSNIKEPLASIITESSAAEFEMPSWAELFAASTQAQTRGLSEIGTWTQDSSHKLSEDIPSFPSLAQKDFSRKLGFSILPCNVGKMHNLKNEIQEPLAQYSRTDIIIGNGDSKASADGVWDALTAADTKMLNVNSRYVEMRVPTQQHIQSSRLCKKLECTTDLKYEPMNRNPCTADETIVAKELSDPYSSHNFPFYSSKLHMHCGNDQKQDVLCEFVKPGHHSIRLIDGTPERPILLSHDPDPDVQVVEKYHSLPVSVKNEFHCSRAENKHIVAPEFDSHMATFTPQVIQSSSFAQRSYTAIDDDDDDLCILEDLSAPARPNLSILKGMPYVTSHHAASSENFAHVGVGQMKLKLNNEQSIFEAALQDLPQPRAEDTPPNDVLSVPLLRHQRIALAWMVKKETTNLHCSGGILADDQGLGKTVSSISLILKERPSSFRAPTFIPKQTETEMLNLDEDTDVDCHSYRHGSSKGVDSNQGNSASSIKKSVLAKGRAAAGTLVVCPTSVLRQWSEELHNKVASKAKLSVLVYHGSNRTKDALELAKYDVVVTTYAIVSMEVPKQRLVEEEEDETGKRSEGCPMKLPYSKKRKNFPSSGSKSSKARRGVDSELLDTGTRPLGRVVWFRVILDEAQYIKNHKTQVARACWGLRAKRRWCLSGTPIQNSIDDLYSYFRFLRFDPYSSYKIFCSSLKVPIQKHPSSGYRKLQAVLKTIMLRRTKSTQIDGEPIINLPPKRIELKRVEFTDEERDFYCKLESDSRAQFAKYAAAGTVNQNYVNILLMLLRLRQACDHPLLVGGSNSSLVWNSSAEMAKKLPQEKQISLLSCLEVSLAICGICSDPPEDAVVSICGHVFCNQCICEHLTVDATHCPAPNCKAHLNVSSVFSKSILTVALSNLPHSVNNPTHETSDVSSSGCSYDSSKIKAALGVLQSLPKSRSGKLGGEKALVFSQWTGMLDLLEACLKKTSIQYRRLDGTMSIAARDKAVKDFNTIPEVSVLIMSLKAASLGLNLVSACHVLLLDLWWNPTTEDQAIDRAHRIGQTQPVKVLRLTVKDTVEDRILALQEKKREMVASAFGEDENGGRQTRLTTEDLQYLFRI